MVINNLNQKELEKLAFIIAKNLNKGSILCLEGDLGAGKTTFTKALAKGLEITDIVTSPTFTILKIYDEVELPLYHFDLYRLNSIEELGFEDYLFGEGVSVVEWSSQVDDFNTLDKIEIKIKYNDLNTRDIEINYQGQRYKELMEVIENEYFNH